MKPIDSATARFEIDLRDCSHKKHRVSSAWSVDITLSFILLIEKFEIHMADTFVGYTHSVSHALEAKWRQ
jgi:hypothetical protein